MKYILTDIEQGFPTLWKNMIASDGYDKGLAIKDRIQLFLATKGYAISPYPRYSANNNIMGHTIHIYRNRVEVKGLGDVRERVLRNAIHKHLPVIMKYYEEDQTSTR